MTRSEILEAYEVNERSVIISPGKFEGEMIYAPYFWDMIMNGEGDSVIDFPDGQFVDVLNIQPEDRNEFPEIDKSTFAVCLGETTDQGFVYCTEYTRDELDELMTEAYAEEKK